MHILALLLCASVCWLRIPTISTIEEILAKPLSLLYFHALDCQYCHAFDPDIEFIADLFNDHHPSFQIVKVDGRKSRDLAQQFGIKSFPALKLYDKANKKVSTFVQERTVANVESFIEELTHLKPNFSHLQQMIHQVDGVGDLEALRATSDQIVLVFVNNQQYEWRTHFYPKHFYQQLAIQFPRIIFGIKFIEEKDYSLMEKYHVSNVPSLIYFHGDSFTIHNTLSTNQMTSNELGYDQILSVIQGSGDYALFSSVGELEEYAHGQEYEGHRQWKGGFNHVESRLSAYSDEFELDRQFEDLLAAISL